MAEQNATNPASAAIGEVHSVTGRVVAIGANGVERQLFAGDLVYPDDLIKTSGKGTIVVALNDGSRFDLGRDAEALLDEAVYSDDVAALKAAALADVAELQRAIAEGADPTEVAEAPAAGGGEGSAGESVQQAVGQDRTGRIGVVEAGFETSGQEQVINPVVIDPIDFGVGDDEGAAAGGTAPVALVISVSAPDNTNDNTPTITGTTDAAPGSTVNLVVTDSLGNVQNLVATVQSDGSYSVEVPVALPDGNYTVDASVSDTAGNTANASDPGSIDTSGGVNDAPAASADVDTTSENASITIDVLSNDTDLDGDTLTVGSVDTTGTNGSVTNNGTDVSYDPGSAYDYLAVGESATDTFTYTVSDGNGGTDTETVTVTITGTNDAPELSVTDLAAIEDGISVSGTPSFTDVDLGDAHTYSVTPMAAGQGSVSIDAGTGEYTYNPGSDFQSLAEGDTTTVSFDVTVDDGEGGTDTETVTVTITGTNDAPELSVTDLAATEDGISVSGTPSFTDVDLGDAHTYSVSAMAAGQGSVSIDAGTGEYTYNPGSDFQSLADGATTTVSFDVTVDDGEGGSDTETVTVTITGTNDDPILTVTDLAATEDGVSVSDTPSFTDVDLGDAHTYSVSAMAAGQGSVSIDAGTGEYTYNPGSDFQSLADGDTTTVSFDVTVDDGEGGADTETVTVTITGTNDAPELSVTDLAAIEDGISVSGTPSFTDVDLGDAHTYSVSAMAAGQGSVSIDAGTGEYTYNPGSDFQSLADGATTTVSFDVTLDDGEGGTDTETVTVTITGTNDDPILTVTDLAATEDGVSVSDTPSFTDVDLGDAHTYSVSAMAAGQGSVSIDAGTGEYTYNPGADFQSLANGATTTASFDVTVDDGEGGIDTETVTVTITGTNDAPELTVSDLAATEDGISVSGTPSFTDVDLGDSHSYSVTPMAAGQGSVSINATTGVYTYNPGSDFQSLADGDTTTVSFDVTVDDGEGGSDTETVTVTITGTNDAPELTISDLAATEDGVSVSDTPSFTDVDLGDAHTYSVSAMAAGQGSVSIDAGTGEYTYNPGSDFQSLADGDTTTVSFDVTVDDGEGGTDTETVTVTITGTNDAPELSVSDLSADEDGISVSGTPSFTDVDLGDAHTYSVTPMAAGQGSVSINATTGVYTYNPGSDFQSLADGATTTVSFDVTVDDGEGGTDTETVTVTITGTNDAPELSVSDLSADEDGVSVSGTPSFTDVDLGDAHTYSVTPMAAGQGSVSIDAGTGEYTYNPGSDFQSLADGDTTTVSFDVTVDDGEGGTDTETVTVTITGTNDAPELTISDLAATEDGVSVSATPSFTDVDLGDAHTYSVTPMAAGQGSVSINATTGVYTYNPGSDFQSLADGDTTTVSFDVTVDDGQGGTDTETVTVTITGTNDDPILTVTDLAATEDGVSVSGTPSFTDVDLGDAHTFSVTAMAAGQGSVSIDAGTGEYTYNPGADFQSLANGATTTASFDVTVDDGEGGTDTETVTVTITGTNDDPILTVTDLAATEDGISVSGTPSFTDVDLGDAHTYSVTPMAAGQGSVSINATTGVYTYNPGSDFQSLADGDTTTVSFDVTVDDGEGGTDTETVTVTITGTNDDPILTVTDLAATEDGVSVSGTPSFTDVDLGDSHSYSVSAMPAGQGSVSIDAGSGEYTYNPGADFQSLADGDTTTVSFDVTVDDGEGGSDTETVTVTITGTNDAPELSVSDLAATEDGVSVSDTPSFTDVDLGDAHTYSVTPMAAGQGSVSIDAGTGEYTYNPGSDFQSLADGDTTTVSFDVTVDDGEGGTDTETVTVTITGTNDAPELTISDLAATEDGVSVSATPSFTDVDLGDAHTYSVTPMAAGQGSVSIDAGTGEYTYNPGSDFQSLADGDTTTVSFDVTVDDGEGGTDTETVTVTITGTNDDPILTVTDLAATEDGVSVSGTPSFTDVDLGDAHTYSVTPMAAGQGSVSIDAGTGEYTYNPGSDFQSLADGDTTTVSFDVTVDDGEGGTDTETVTVTITGTNDDPILTVTDLAATEDGVSVSGTPSFTDVDLGDSHSYSVTAMAPGQGNVSIDAGTGEYTYNPGSDFQSLADGDTTTVSFDVTVDDGEGGTDTETVTVTITGTNDDPELSVSDLSADEDGISVSGTPSFTDVDLGDAHTFSVTPMAAGQGSVSINATTGVYTYNPGSDFQSLAEGDTTTVSFDVTVDDGEGGTDTETVTVTITGTNDAPDLSVSDLSADEDGVSVSGTPSFTDVDLGDAHTYSVTPMAAGQGSVSINATTGVYTYNPGSDFQSLADGDTTTVSFDVTVDDGEGGSDTETVTVTITGTNDAPIASDDGFVVPEDGTVVLDLTGNDSDPDGDTISVKSINGEALTGGVQSIAVDNGTVDIAIDGTVSFTPAANYNGPISFDYVLTDGAADDTATVTGNVGGTNDTPVAVDDMGAVDENATLSVLEVDGVIGNLTTGDSDSDGDVLTVSAVRTGAEGDVGSPGAVGSGLAGAYGTLTLADDGSYSYTADQAAADALAAGASATDVFTYTVSDGMGGTDTAEIVITITGTNDDPVLTVSDLAATEDGSSVSGTPSFTDVDLGDSHSYSVSAMPAGQGSVSIDAGTGEYTYNPGGDFQSLADGATTTVSFDVTLDDGEGGTDTETVTVTITGTNDAPELSVTDLAATEDGISVSGTPSFTDVDLGDSHSYSVSAMPAGQGSVSINATTGVYTYNPGSDFQSLADGATTTVSFDVTVDDGEGGSDTETVTVTITGTNDAPELTVSDLAATEDGISVSGTPSFTDVDLGDAHTYSVSAMAAGQGSVSINATTGVYTYNPGSDFQSLADGDTTTVSFDVTVDDGEGGTDTETVTVTITGTNDDSILTVTDLAATEDGVSVSGTPSFTDVDLGDSHSYSVSAMPAGQGSVSINATTGVYTYNPGSDFQSLAEGDTTTVSFDVTVDDGEGGSDTETVTVTITGTNDAPDLSVSDLSADEDGISVSGTPSFTDVDLGDAHTYSVSAMAAGQGSVSIDAGTGEYTYNPGSDFQSLADGDTTTVSFDVTVDDGQGGSDTETVTVTITGTNDAPELSVSDLSADEDGISVSGTPSFTDVDLGDAHTYSVTPMAPGQGSVSIDAGTGEYTYNPGGDFQSLANGDTTTVSFDVTVDDGQGGAGTETVTVTITGTNDAPELSVSDLSADEDGISVSATPSFTDVDLGDAHTYSVTPMAAGQGSVSIDAGTGEYTYNPGADFQSLADGATTTVSFDVTVDDGEGGSDTETVTVTITGTNDAPELSVSDLAATEDGISVSGTPSFTDVDLGDSHSYSVSAMPAGQGSVSIDAGTGEYTYNPGSDFQSLAEGDTTTVSFDVTVDDGEGGSDTETVTVTITGTNDAPDLSVSDLSADEDGVSVSGTPSFTDVDLGDAHTYSVTPMAAGQGSVSIDAGTGEYTYNPGGDFQSLANGDTTTVSFDVTVDDGQGGADTETVTVTITGTNDAPELSVSDLSADEDGISVSATPSFTDVDLGDAHTYSVTPMAAGQGSVSIDAGTGEYTYNPGSDFQSLADGDTTTVSFDVTVDDGQGGTDTETVTVTITGTNDAPELSVSDLAAAEDGISVSATPSFTDVDLGDSHSYSVTAMAPGQGSVSIDAGTGEYTYNPGSDFQSLADGDTTTVSFDVTVDDGEGGTDTETVTVTITGTNDDPVLTVSDLSATEDGVSVSGTPSFTDVDLGDAHTYSVTPMAAGQGSVSIDAGTGEYTYNPGSDFQSLADGDTTTVSFDVTVDDGEGGTDTETVTVTITGTNDDPVLTVSDLSATEDGVSVSDTPSFTDVDLGDAHTYSVTPMAAGQGSVSINATTGEYTYNPGADFQSLADGATTTVSFDVTVDDGEGGSDTETVTVTITGTNDAPELSVSDLSADEDGVSVSDTPSFTDVDLGDAHTYSVSAMAAGQGSVSIDAGTGEYTYNPGADFQSLADGATTTVSFDVTVDDGQGGTDTETVTVTITGTNDAPELSVSDLSADEDGVSVSDTPSFTDVDLGDAHTYSVSAMAAGQGSVSIDAGTGEYTYNPGADFQSLADGATTTVSFDVTVDDGQGGTDTETVTVTITGTNDAPELSVSDLSADEDGVSVSDTPSFTDVDLGDAHTYSVTPMAAGQGSVSINATTGVYTYNPGSDFQSLADGDTTTVSFDVTVDDGEGGADTETVTVTITGTNDAPELSVSDLSADEDGISVSGTPSFTDVDLGDSHSYSVTAMAAGQGNVSIDAGTGEYTYNPGSDFQSLADGDTTTVSFDVTVDDGEGGTDTETVTVTITGTNDAPELSVTDLAATEDGISVSGTPSFTDVDLGDSHSYSVTPMAAGQGSVSINATTGVYTYNPGSDFQSLADGATTTVSFDVTVDDGEGGSDTETVTVTITGTNDAPELSVTDLAATEDGISVSGTPSFTDVDLGDAHTYSVTPMAVGQGSVSIDAGTGEYTYNPGSDFQSLADGATTTVSFDVTLDDGEGGTDTETVTVTITGTNDDPILTVTDLAATEDGVSVSGTPSFTDVDLGDAHTYSVTPMAAGQGSVSIDAGTGVYTYNPGSDFQSLADGATTTVSFDVTVDDGEGGSDTETVTVTITGTNDAPELSVTDLAATEDGISVSGTPSFTDVDLGDAHTYSVTPMAVGQGSVSIDAGTGEYTYNPGSDFQSLADGATTTVSFDVTLDDGEGGTDTETVTVTITGTNDDPILTVTDLAATEDGVSVSGTPSFTDVDLGDAHTYSVTPMAAGQGSVSIDAGTGEYTYNPGSDFQSLADGDTTTVSFDVTVDDGEGGTDTETVTVTITGTNDDPVLTVSDLSATEDGVSVSDTPSFTDVDLGDAHTYSVTPMAAGQGSVSINATTGEYTYNPGADFQSLADGATTTVSFDVTVDDGEGGTDTETVTVTITGTNDAPELTVSDLSADEDGISVSATPSFTDVDLGDAHTYSVTPMAAGQGSVSINATTGVYTYNPGADFQSLAEGDTTTVSFDVTVDDGEGGTDTETVTVTITGTNDAPDLSVSDLSADEDGVSVSGTPSFTDVDLGDSHSYSVTPMAAGQGSVSINATTGVYTYNPGADFQSLAEGDTTTVSFDVTVDDGEGGTDTETVTVTITGTNDAPDLSVSDLSADEDGVSVSGTPSFTDVDLGDAHTYSVTPMAAGQGSVSINATTGEYTYNPGSDFQSLADGDTTTVSFDVTVDDGEGGTDTETVTVTITGTNDDPILTVTDLAATEDGISVSGTPSFTDVDLGDSHSYSVTAMAPGQGSVSIDAGTGEYTYNPGSDFQSLADGDTTTVSFDVTVDDGQGGTDTETVTVTITGTNDDPVLTVSDLSATEDGISVSGTPSFTDVDLGDAHTYSVTPMAAGQGSVSIDAGTGEYTYNPGSDFQSLADGDTTTVSFDVIVDDGEGGTDTETVTVTITGTNDGPTLDLDANDSSGATGADYQTSFVEGGSPVLISDLDIDIADIDSPKMDSATITLTNAEAGDVLDVSGVLGVGVSVDTSISGEITVTLTGPADQTVFESAIKAITFENTADSAVAGDRVIDVQINDGDGGSASALTTISVTPVPSLSVTDVSVSEPEATLSGTAVVTGSIEDAGSDTAVDHWTFVHTGGALTIDATETSGGLDTHILLFELNPDGTLGALVADDKDDGPGNDAMISGNFAAGDYAVVIGDETLSEDEARDPSAFPNNANDGGNYQITLTGAAYVDGTGDTVGFPANAGTVVDSGLSNATIDLTYTVSLDEAPTVATGDVTVSYEIVDGTANAGTDYSVGMANPGTLTFAPGETSKTITVTVNADAVIESNETVLLNLTGLSANAAYDGSAHVIPDGIQGIGTILSADNPPEILNNSLTIEEGQTVVLTPSDLSATDADSNDPDLLFMMTNIERGEFQLVSTGETITSFTQQQIIDGEIQFVHDGGEDAPSYDVTVTDGLLIDTGTPAIVFDANANDAPVADDDTYNVFEDIAVGTHLGTVVASDPDLPAQPLTYTITGGDPSGLFAIDAYGNITLAGGLDFDAQAMHTLTVEVSDGALTDTATITINVADQNAPIALDSAVTTAEDTQHVFTSGEFGFIDQDGDAMASVTITGLESVGSLRLWNGSDYDNVIVGDVISKAQLDSGDLVFDAAPDDNGLPYDSFAFSVNDDSGSAGTTSAAMTVNVTPVNDSPVSPVTDSDAGINLVGEAALVGAAVGLTGLATDLDPEDSVSYQLINNPNGYFSIDPLTGEVTVASPLSVGAYDVLIRATSTDGTSSEETFTIQVVDAADDFSTVHESALRGGTGRTESAFDDNDEAGQDVAAGNGTTIATGNLLSNDPGATGITEINGVTPVGGVITVNSANGQLAVDASTGDYTFTLTGPVDNSLTGDGQSALDSFSYTTNIGSANLNITIVDDVVQSNDVVTNVAEAAVEPYQLVFTLDVSGSMTGAQWGGVVYLDDGSTTTRLEMAKDALQALATEYFSQSDSVELYLSTFESTASLLNGGAPYTDLQSALTAIDGINGSGGTNYEAGLETIIDALDANGDGFLDNTGSKAITYFISDGVPTSGNTGDPVGASGWDTFLANNAVDSYGVGIGAGITDFSHLDAINNVDADGSGTSDGALNVSDVDSLESVLLGTVPAAYGGSVVVNQGVSHVDFGADGGFVQSITIDLDTDSDSTPDTSVSFVYDPATDQISNDGGFATVSGDILTLDGPGYGFTHGTLIFNFSEGSYSYFVGAGVNEGDSFSLDFVAADGDGDLADLSRLTMNIVDGQPVANNDVDTLFANGTSLEGNVITAVGTDGGVALGSAVASFALQGSGVDVSIDDAQVTAVDYRGTSIDLTLDSSGSGTGGDGSVFSFTVSGGVLTLTNATDGSQLVFNTSGYYSYVPADLPVAPTGAAITEVFTDGGTGQGVILSTNDGTVTYQSTYGAGIDDGVEDATDARDVDYGETLTIEFDQASYVYGVANVSLELYGLTGTYESYDIAVYSVNGSLIGQYSVGDVSTFHTENLPAEYSSIGRIEIQGGSATEASIRQVSFQPVLLDTVSAGLEPEVIAYTLTDTDGQSDSATLTLSTIHNTLTGSAAADVITGTVANDLLSGLDGDDILSGGDGRDILEGGVGNDNLYGEGGSDRLVGDEGDDLLVGADGNDVLLGGEGADTLQGDAGADELEGGQGNDTLLGGADNDVLRGNEGDDSLDGGTADDALYGGEGNDILVGGDGNDLLFGNVGDDVMGGGSGGDTFVWKLNEQGTPTEPAVDVVTDFSVAEGDALDLSDLLVDEQSNELTDYLHFEYDADNNQTVVQIDQDGGMFFRPTQEIVLEGVDLTGAGSFTDQQIIDTLIAGNNLITD